MQVKILKNGITRVSAYPPPRPFFSVLEKAEEMRQWCTETLGKGGSNFKKTNGGMVGFMTMFGSTSKTQKMQHYSS